jgi:hypothetical protein
MIRVIAAVFIVSFVLPIFALIQLLFLCSIFIQSLFSSCKDLFSLLGRKRMLCEVCIHWVCLSFLVFVFIGEEWFDYFLKSL